MSPEPYQTSKSSGQYPTQQGDKEGTPIVYDKIEKNDDHVIGFASYKDPQGFGAFTIRVSGSEDGINEYAATARVVQLQLIPLRQADTRAANASRQTAADYWRTVWQQRLERLKQLVTDADVELLADPDRLWQKCRDLERAETNFHSTPNWDRDRLIRIEPVSDLAKDEAYWFSMIIDPVLNNFGANYYSLWSSGFWSWPSAQTGSIAAWEQAFYSEGMANRGLTVWETAGGYAEYTITVNGIYYR